MNDVMKALRKMHNLERLATEIYRMQTGSFREEKAIKDYSAFLDRVDFDAKSRALIEKNTEDERLHVRRWQDSMEMLKRRQALQQGKEQG